MGEGTDLTTLVAISWFAGLTVGLLIGKLGADRIWRGKGDHEYMNTMASGGNLYQVKRETIRPTPAKRSKPTEPMSPGFMEQ